MTKPTLTTTVVSDLAWQQLTQMDAPANSPISSSVAGVAPVQSWEETDQVLPDIGQVDNELLAAAGLSNTILVSVATAEVLKTITVSIGANGNWFVGGADTGVAAKGTDESLIVRPTGVYGTASVFQNANTLKIGAGLMYGVKEGSKFYTLTTTAEISVPISPAVNFVTIDRTGTIRTYDSSVNLWLIPESQALVALVTDTGAGANVYAVPTVHNAMLMAAAVIPYSQEAITAAQAASTHALLAYQYKEEAKTAATQAAGYLDSVHNDAAAAAQSAIQAAASKDAAGNFAAAAEVSKNKAKEFADYADADRVATAADRLAVAADKASADNSKNLALQYKDAAGAFAVNAEDSKSKAAEYATNGEDVPLSFAPTEYSSKHWAAKSQQWAQAVSAALVWKGQWNATMGAAPPTPALGTGAHFYRISGAGVINGTEYAVGDYIHWDTVGKSWFKIDGTDAVVTVNGKAPIGGNVALNYADVGAEQAGVAATLVGTHAATANVHAISAINGLQGALDSKYSPTNLPTPAALGALPAEGAALATDCNSLITKGRYALQGTNANWPYPSNGGLLDVYELNSGYLIQVALRAGSALMSYRVYSLGTWSGWSTLYAQNNKPTPAELGALAATSYKPRSDSLNLTERAIGTTENKNMNTCVAGDYGLYNAGSCANSPNVYTGWYYCETISIYAGALLQLAFPYDNQGTPCFRNYSINSSSWSGWRVFNDWGVAFSGQMRGNATGGSYASVNNRNDAPFTATSNHSGSSFAPALNMRYTHNTGWGGTYYIGDLCESAASAGSLAIGHVNTAGGEGWTMTYRGSDGYAYFPSSVTAVDYQIRSDKSVKDNFEPITNALEKVAALEVAIYDKFSDTSKTKKIVREYGTIANSMQAVDELLVAENKGLLYNSVSGQLALLTAAVQELKVKLGV